MILKKHLSSLIKLVSPIIDKFESKIEQLNIQVEKGATISNQSYLTLLNEWIYYPDGSLIEKKIEAKSRILNYLHSSNNFDNYDLDSNLSLNGLKLKTIPPLFQLTELENLDLSDNALTHCNPFTFLCNKNLESLNLESNKFKAFDVASSIHSKSLNILNLKNNQLENIAPTYFSDLPNLKELYLDANSIGNIDIHAFKNCPKLNLLSMSQNKLTAVPIDFFKKLPTVKTFNFNKNNIQHFNEFPTRRVPTSVNLTQNPLDVKDLIALLDIMYTQKDEYTYFQLPIDMDKFGFIKSTHSKKTNAIQYPRFVDYLEALNQWVESNDGSAIADKKRAQSKILTTLCLYGSYLNLSNLNLKTIPPLTMLTQLYILHFCHNRISKINSSTLPVSVTLKEIDMSNNNISELKSNTFERLPQLQTMVLNYNKLTELKETLKNTKLKYIYLNHNEITEVDETFLKNQTLLRVFSITNNQLPYLSPNIWKNLYDLKRLNLSGNRLINFEWNEQNQTTPEINLTRNLFCLDTIETLTALQNTENYRGPIFLFSTQNVTSIPTANITFDSFQETLSLWIKKPTEKCLHILMETSNDQRILYNNVNIFLTRLYNETSRELDGSIPKEVSDHVTKILQILVDYNFDNNLWLAFCNQSFNAVSDCVDRIGIVLVWMSIYTQHFDAEKKGNLHLEKKLKKQLETFDKVIQFLEDIHHYKIIYDKLSEKFIHFSEIISEGVLIPCKNRTVYYDDCVNDIDMRIKVLTVLNLSGKKIKVFTLNEQVEDAFLIINTLSKRSLCDIDTIRMVFGGVATLKDYLTPVIDFLKKQL